MLYDKYHTALLFFKILLNNRWHITSLILNVSVLEKYADFWCSKLTDPEGVFAPCHAVISPTTYKDVGLNMQSFNENFAAELLLIVSRILFWQNCMYDTCNCEKSEDCMCAAVSSYVYACSAAGVHISGWRKTVCGK